jgi:hypothetical protein
MKKSKFTDQKIALSLQQAEGDTPVEEATPADPSPSIRGPG